MIKTNFDSIIDKIKQTLSERYEDFKGIYFYGSRVRGDNNQDSDYDIVIVFDREIDWKFKNEVRSIVYLFMVENDLLIDCKVISQKGISDPSTPFEVNVKKEGIYYGV